MCEKLRSMPISANEDPNIEAILIPWEISALNLVLTFWRYVSLAPSLNRSSHLDISNAIGQ